MAPMIDPTTEAGPQLAPGTYRAQILNCELKTGKTGSRYLNWKFAVGSQWVFHTNGLTGKGAEVLKDIVRAAKYPDYEGGPINTDDLLGSFITITIDQGVNPDGSPSQYMRVLEVAPDRAEFGEWEPGATG